MVDLPSVLVVDDDPDIRSVIAFKLERAGFTVFEEVDGEAGLAAAAQEHPDLVLLDWMMPRLSGVEVCRALRDDASLDGTAVIMLTAKAQEPDVQRAFAAGADDYIVKPFSPRELVSRVQAVLARVGADARDRT
jgi:DNA-binding response OmpR family regulator